MSEDNALAVLEPETEKPIEPLEIATEVGGDEAVSFQAVALNATEMQAANGQIREFLEVKVAEVDRELEEVTAAHSVAKTRKWATTALYNQMRSITRRKTYYDKLLAAVNAGYTIVPNMPCDVFVIRTNQYRPKATEVVGNQYSVSQLRDVEPERLPIGEGHHESSQQRQYVTTFEQKYTDGSSKTLQKRVGIQKFHEIEFPLAVAHPVIMAATDHAMKQKIFDRIGIVPQGTMTRKADPIVLGQVMYKVGYNTKTVSFLIGWHLDLRSL